MNDAIYDLGLSPNFKEDKTAFAARESGLYRTTDGGKTWTNTFDSLGVDEQVPALAVAISPNFGYDKTVFAGTFGVVLNTINAGETWIGMRLQEPIPLVSCLVVSPNYAEDGLVYAGTIQDGVFTSANRGEGFVGWNYGLLDQHVYGLTTEGNAVYAAVDTGVYRSSNRGRRWDEVGKVMDFGPNNIVAFIAEAMFIASEESGLYVSHNDGKTYKRIAEEQFPGAVNYMKALNGQLVAASDFVVWVSKDVGKTWTQVSAAPEGESVMIFDVSPDGTVLVGYSDGTLGWYSI